MLNAHISIMASRTRYSRIQDSYSWYLLFIIFLLFEIRYDATRQFAMLRYYAETSPPCL